MKITFMLWKSTYKMTWLFKYRPDWFISGLLLAILAAWFKPEIGASTTINLGLIINAGIVLIFFLYGLKLDTKNLLRDVSNWRMHLAVQTTTFLIFPLLILPFYPIFKNSSMEIYWLGMLFLAALPSTVSSSVIMVSIAGGNIPGAIFNATISGITGILMTPLWMGLFVKANMGDFNYPAIILQLVLRIILPVLAGLLLNRFLNAVVGRHLKKLAAFDKIIILLIVYHSFSQTFLAGMFDKISWADLIVLSAAITVLFFTIIAVTRLLALVLKINQKDKITLIFAGSQKSLIHGSVFASVLFVGTGSAGIILIPVMLYHTLQLIATSIMARKMVVTPPHPGYQPN